MIGKNVQPLKLFPTQIITLLKNRTSNGGQGEPITIRGLFIYKMYQGCTKSITILCVVNPNLGTFLQIVVQYLRLNPIDFLSSHFLYIAKKI